MREINFIIPFYGMPGTISRVVTDLKNKCYWIFEYDADGKEKNGKPISRKNVNNLEKNCYLDILGYLKANESKINTYQNTRLKKQINLKSLYIDAIVSGILSVIGLGLSFISIQVAPISWTTGISLLIFASSGTYLGIKVKDKLIYDKDIKKAKTIHQYRSYQKKAIEYFSKKEKQYTPTKYKGLAAKKGSNGNTMKMIRILEK